MHGFELGAMLAQGWPILTILLVMSVLSCTVIVDRYCAFRRARADAKAFIARVCRTLKTQSRTDAYDFCMKFNQPAAVVAAAVIAQEGDRESKERALRHALQEQIQELEVYIPILGTVAGTAPFVGLLGTVMGIIRAFADIAHNVGGGPEVVSAGIAEALITTAGGLLVAIPALIAYNYFVRQTQRMADEIDLASYELIEALSGGR